MQTITTTVYGVKELELAIQDKVIAKFRDINTDSSDWSDIVTEEYTEMLKERGYFDVKIFFSGFGSQGDGACFIAKLDVTNWLQYHKNNADYSAFGFLDSLDDVQVSIKHNWRYYFASSTDVDVSLNDDEKATPEILEALDRLTRAIEEERTQLGNVIYRALNDTYDDLTSDEAVVDTLAANEYKFLANGTLFNE